MAETLHGRFTGIDQFIEIDTGEPPAQLQRFCHVASLSH